MSRRRRKRKEKRLQDITDAGEWLAAKRREMRREKSHLDRQRIQKRKPWEWLAALARSDYDAYLNTEHWKKTRARAYRTHGRKCKVCGSKNRIEVHHLTYKRVGHERMSDLRILCHDCHLHEHEGKKGIMDPMTEEFVELFR